jgi:endonuclease/exonuclease/phosphatase family metal-dependent hydrolase
MAVLGGAVAANAHRSASAPPWIVPAIAATALLIVPLALWATEPQPPETVPALVADESPNEVLVVTYDLNHGFDPAGRLALEPMVATLAESAWEIGSLQEVGRGGLRFGGVDMVTWLEHRLATDVAWVPSGSRLSGIALISRFGLADVAALPLEADGAHPVAAIDAHVALPGSDLTLRMLGVAVPDEQAADAVAMLIEGWRAEGGSVVLGSLGGGPESEPVQAVLAAGFYDVGRLVDGSPATYPSSAPTEQRDLVLISQDLSLSAVRVLDSTASDHRPVVVRVHLIPPEG